MSKEEQIAHFFWFCASLWFLWLVVRHLLIPSILEGRKMEREERERQWKLTDDMREYMLHVRGLDR